MHEYELLVLEGPYDENASMWDPYHTAYSVIVAKCHAWWERRSFSVTIDAP